MNVLVKSMMMTITTIQMASVVQSLFNTKENKMGAQHTFNYCFPVESISITDDELLEKVKNLPILDNNSKENLTVERMHGAVFINFSFYSSYSYLKDLEMDMKDFLRTVLKSSTLVEFHYEEIKEDTETFCT